MSEVLAGAHIVLLLVLMLRLYRSAVEVCMCFGGWLPCHGETPGNLLCDLCANNDISSIGK